jgi:Lrp/AsnC family leucine-responsive transcriptional regulator
LRRSGPVSLDKIDLHLLDLLQHDVARTLRELGEAVRLSPSAVHRRLARYDSSGLIARRVAILDAQSLGGRQLAVVLVTLEETSGRDDASLRARLIATPEVQQCYDVAGEWDYVVVLVTGGMHECRELGERLFLDEPGVKRFVTLPVFEAVKLGLDIPVRRAADR